jgi:transposase-like protein
VLSHLDFPEQHRAKVHSTNPLERLNKMGYPGQHAFGGLRSAA